MIWVIINSGILMLLNKSVSEFMGVVVNKINMALTVKKVFRIRVIKETAPYVIGSESIKKAILRSNQRLESPAKITKGNTGKIR